MKIIYKNLQVANRKHTFLSYREENKNKSKSNLLDVCGFRFRNKGEMFENISTHEIWLKTEKVTAKAIPHPFSVDRSKQYHLYTLKAELPIYGHVLDSKSLKAYNSIYNYFCEKYLFSSQNLLIRIRQGIAFEHFDELSEDHNHLCKWLLLGVGGQTNVTFAHEMKDGIITLTFEILQENAFLEVRGKDTIGSSQEMADTMLISDTTIEKNTPINNYDGCAGASQIDWKAKPSQNQE